MNTRFEFDFASWTESSGQSSHLVIEDYVSAGRTYARIFDYYHGDFTALASFDGIIIRSIQPHITRLCIAKIRTIRHNYIDLKPLVVEWGGSTKIFEATSADAFISDLAEMGKIAGKVEHLLGRTRDINTVEMHRYDDGVLYALLSFMYTRSLELIEPILDANSRTGFWYPMITEYDLASTNHLMHHLILDRAENAGYLSGHFKNVSYVCNQCSGGFLQFREVCPACHSAHIANQEMVHHFRCAHVAPISEFRPANYDGQGLHCPKCSRDLKHIGVDYDKPSELHQCRTCNHEFQFYSVRAKCTSCGQDQEVEHLAKKEYKSFGITQKAIAALKQGALSETQHAKSDDIEGAIEWEVFRNNLTFELNRDVPETPTVVRLEFSDYEQLQRKVGLGNIKKLLAEIVQIIKASQGVPDYCTVKVPVIYFTLHEVSDKEAEKIVQRTIFLLQHLISDNLHLKHVALTYDIRPASELLLELEAKISE